MNKRLLMALALSFLTVWIFQYFTKKDDGIGGSAGKVNPGEVRSGQFYNTPVQQSWHCEPNREIDFIDVAIKPEHQSVVDVKTPLYVARFSNFGGVLQSLSFNKHKSKAGGNLETIENDVFEQREEGCFLLALKEKTPYVYQLVSHEKSGNGQVLVYQTKHLDWLIRKTYVLSNDSYRVDIQFDFEPLKNNVNPLAPRLFFPSPYVEEIADNVINGVVTHDGKRIDKVLQKNELSGVWGIPEIFGSEDKYFAHTLVKDDGHFTQGGYYKRVNKKLFSILEGQEIKEKKTINLSFYMGPKLLQDLSAVDERLEDLLSFGWLSWICKQLLRLLEYLYKHIGNFGLAIIVLTIVLKLPFVPLSISSRRKMERYQKYQPTITRIRNKYKTDLKRQQEEIMRFHQEHNLSPATPMVGCLPMIIQLPILFALYRVLGSYLSLYQAPFFGWIHDLSARDPYYILPILMGVTMLLQQTMSPASGDSKQRAMMMFMPVVMTAVFINFPAGLVLYWLMNNVLTVLEDVVRKRVL